MGSRVFSVLNCTLQGVLPPFKSSTVPYPTWCWHESRAKDSTCLFPAVLLGFSCPACTDKAAVGFIWEWWPNSGRWGWGLQLRSAPLSKGCLELISQTWVWELVVEGRLCLMTYQYYNKVATSVWVDGTFIYFMCEFRGEALLQTVECNVILKAPLFEVLQSDSVWGKRPVYCSTFCSSCKSLCSCTWLGVSVSLCEVFLPCFHHSFHFSEAWNVVWRSAISALQSCKL